MAKMGYPNVLRWAKLITITGLYQIIVQAFGILCGILVIRMLSIEEYALYTLANTMLGVMSVLSDGGVSSGVMAQGGKFWKDKEKLGSVLKTGLILKKQFAIFSLLSITPLLIYLLRHNGANWKNILLIVLAVFLIFYLSLSDNLLEIIPKLHQSIVPLQKNQVFVAACRLALSGVALVIFPCAFIAILASGIPRFYGNIKLRNISKNFISENTNPSAEIRSNILTMVRRTFPGAIYFSVSGPISIWLISYYGDIQALAQFGALGRVSIIMSSISILISTIVVPRFARISESRVLLMKHFLQIMLSLIFISFVICYLVYSFSNQLLNILGRDYENLNKELLLSIAVSCVGMLTGVAYSLHTARGWSVKPIIFLSLNIFSMMLLLFLNKINTLTGVLLFSVELAFAGFLINAAYCFIKIIKIK